MTHGGILKKSCVWEPGEGRGKGLKHKAQVVIGVKYISFSQ